MSSKSEPLAEKAMPSPDFDKLEDTDNNNNIDPSVDNWDGPNDPANPLNWPDRMRWSHIIVVSLLALVTYV